MIKHFGIVHFTLLAVLFSFSALADITNQNATLAANTGFNLDNGTSGNSGGDILFSGTSIAPQTGATIGGIDNGGISTYNALSQQFLTGVAASFSQTPLTATNLVVGEVFGVHTHGGNYAKALITALSSSSMTIEYTTYGGSASGGGGGPSAPTIAYIQNNSSAIPTGFPNSGIAPSSIFKVHGTGMATAGTTPVLQTPTAATPIPATLNGTSLSVTVNGTTVSPAIYYSSPTDVAAELPANTPVGSN
jgi:hypothetical protein